MFEATPLLAGLWSVPKGEMQAFLSGAASYLMEWVPNSAFGSGRDDRDG